MPYKHDQKNLKRLKKDYAESTKRTVFFVGAGCSIEAGLPGWPQLADQLLKELNHFTPSSAMDEEMLENYRSVETAHENKDYWELFDLAESHWKTFYEDFLTERFSEQALKEVEIPKVYEKMWAMRNVGQIMTFNLDGLLARAYESTGTPHQPKLMEYPGTSALDSQHYFSGNHPTLLNLHGVYSSRSTWVMNKDERERLFSVFRGRNYKDFIKHLFATYNIVFVGINLTDIALSPMLEELTSSGLLTKHYWITADITPEAFRWAQENSIRVIDYTPETGPGGARVDSTVICSILDDIEEFKSMDEEVTLPNLNRISESQMPEPSKLLETQITNRESVVNMLSECFEDIGQEYGFSSQEIERFIERYNIPIQHASIIGKEAPHNIVGGNRLISQISSSQSSSVWMAADTETGQYQVVKALSAQVLKEKDERESFRRGIESLYLLKDTSPKVAPEYISHSNVPLAVTMENIEGYSFEEVRTTNPQIIKDHWHEIFLKICVAVQACHASEGNVLHRDLKPKNILLAGVGYDADARDIRDSKIVLINFDMSWHILSKGSTKSIAADEVGYYAPEQRNFGNSVAPRNAKTDVYMLGMILYSLISTEPPPEGGSRITNWKQMVKSIISIKIPDKLVANRTARLITRMTERDMNNRPDMLEVITELKTISGAIDKDWLHIEPDLYIEKILVDTGMDYEWSDIKMKGRVNTRAAYSLELSLIQRGRSVGIQFERNRDPSASKGNFSKRLKAKIGDINKELQAHDWQSKYSPGYDNTSLVAQKSLKELRENSDAEIKYIISVLSKLTANIE